MGKWVKIMKNYDDRPTRRSMKAYTEGTVDFVPDTTATRLIEAGAAELCNKPSGAKKLKDGTILYDKEFKG